MRIKLRICIGLAVALTSTVCMGSVRYLPGNVEAEISLKVPGNEAVDYQLHPRSWRIIILIIKCVETINCP